MERRYRTRKTRENLPAVHCGGRCGHLDKVKQRRIAAVEAHRYSRPAGPYAGRRTQSQFIDDAWFHLVQSVARRVGLAGFRRRRELEINAVVEE
jgi:hypothetical protein